MSISRARFLLLLLVLPLAGCVHTGRPCTGPLRPINTPAPPAAAAHPPGGP